MPPLTFLTTNANAAGGGSGGGIADELGAPYFSSAPYAFIAATDTRIYGSDDGVTWTILSTFTARDRNQPLGAIAGNGTQWGFGAEGAAVNYFQYSDFSLSSVGSADPITTPDNWDQMEGLIYNPAYNRWVACRDVGAEGDTRDNMAYLDAATYSLPGTGNWVTSEFPPILATGGNIRSANVLCDNHDPDSLYFGNIAAAGRQDKIAYSEDGGATWIEAPTQVTLGSGTAYTMVYDRVNSRFLLAVAGSSPRGIVTGNQRGTSWSNSPFALSGIDLYGLDVNPVTGVFCAGTSDGRIYRFDGAGSTSTINLPGRGGTENIYSIAYSPTEDLWIANDTASPGTDTVWTSTNDGATWTENAGAAPEPLSYLTAAK